ncbi:MAG: Ku protein [Bdellovibrionota bacterium]
MARGIWSGAISFGLINIPVQLMTAKQEEKISFRMLDKRDNAPIGYKQINKSTGKEVERKDIIKAYEYSRDQFVVVTEDDFKKANPKATQTIDIEDFVDLEDVDPLLFETPYYLVPGKNGEKGYVLLRKTLERTKKAAVCQFVLRKKQHLAVVLARGDYLVLEVLRFAHEIKEVKEARFLDDYDLEKVRISERELKMAEQLVDGMTGEWKPSQYKDTYYDDLMSLIEKKVKGGDVETPPDMEAEEKTNTNSDDLASLLQRSLKGRKSASTASGKPRRRKAASARKVSARARKSDHRGARMH